KKDLSLLGLKEENIKIVYCGIDQNKYIYRKEKKEFGIILYMGRLKRYKSVDHLIKVVPLLLKKRSDFKIIIAGDGDARDELIKLARKERVESFIEFKFDVSEQEKIELYQRAWLLVQPSVKEGWGLTVIEANACGTPSVAARSPGLIESVQDGKTGYLYNYGDLEDLCRKIERLLSNRKEWEGFSQASIEWAKRFSWEESANEMESILTAFLSDQKR
ncbi:MAG: glycosyltransferase family 4 protein, partial [candidate division WOR-3 bacterium]